MTSVASSNLGYVTSATPMYVNEEKWDETRHALIEHFRARGVQLLIVKQEIHEPGTKAAGLDVPSASGAPSDETALGTKEKEGQEQDANLTALLETAGLKPNEMDGDALTAVLTVLKEQGFAVNKTAASEAPSRKESADVAQQATSMIQAPVRHDRATAPSDAGDIAGPRTLRVTLTRQVTRHQPHPRCQWHLSGVWRVLQLQPDHQQRC